jgi:hypothetical protein
MPRETPKQVIAAAIARWKQAKGTSAAEIVKPTNNDARLWGSAER